MKLHVLSDLHREFALFDPSPKATAMADVIVLAGDIDVGTNGIRWARLAWPEKPVVYVCGNHELYGGHWAESLQDMRDEARSCGVHFLEDEAVEIDGVRFLGCALWTDFDHFGPEERQRCMDQTEHALADFRHIYAEELPHVKRVKPNQLTAEHTRLRHLASRAWLERKLTESDPARTVVVTHHYPSLQSCAPRFRYDPVTAGFGSQLPAALLSRASLWIHGHTHDSCDYELWHQEDDAFRETRVVCNPRGYPMSRASNRFENPEFDPQLLVEL